MSQPTPGPQLIAPGYIQRLEEVNADLLAALKAMEELSECYCYSTQPGEPCATCTARAAIARAEGAS